MSELQIAIEALYEAFSREPRPVSVEGCPCCTSPDETAPLLAKPLRGLNSEDLLSYAFSAMTTQGTTEDFRYFLPRLFEAITQDLTGICPEMLFHHLAYAEWTTWPADETESIRQYMFALWKFAVSSYPMQDRLRPFYEIETLLACLVQTGESLEHYLRYWGDNKSAEASENLIQFVAFHGEDFSGGSTFHEAFWKDFGSQGQELREWLLQPVTMDRIERSAHLLRDDGWEHLFEPSMKALRHEVEQAPRG